MMRNERFLTYLDELLKNSSIIINTKKVKGKEVAPQLSTNVKPDLLIN